MKSIIINATLTTIGSLSIALSIALPVSEGQQGNNSHRHARH